jgi:hypothetical protein
MCGGISHGEGSYAAVIEDDLTFEMGLDDHSPKGAFTGNLHPINP